MDPEVMERKASRHSAGNLDQDREIDRLARRSGTCAIRDDFPRMTAHTGRWGYCLRESLESREALEHSVDAGDATHDRRISHNKLDLRLTEVRRNYRRMNPLKHFHQRLFPAGSESCEQGKVHRSDSSRI